MARLDTEWGLRLRQSFPGNLRTSFAGAEANVAVDIAMYGGEARYVTALPSNPMAQAAVDQMRGLGVDTRYVLRPATGRMGLLFVESGANQRPSNVVYDRESSTFARASASDYDWDRALEDAAWFHTTGISPAVSQIAAEATLYGVKTASDRGASISIDLNYRGKLWKWSPEKTGRELAREVMADILPYADVVIGNEEDAFDALGIRSGDSDVAAGRLDVGRYAQAAREICERFSRVKYVAFTLRESISATVNRWGALLYSRLEDSAHFAPTNADGEYSPFEITSIVDRVGAGDSFAAGLIFSLLKGPEVSPATATRFSVAASCLAHSIRGDYNYTTYDEILRLADGDKSGRVVR